MANHKRKRPKNRRAGCIQCKAWKMNGFGINRKDGEEMASHRRRLAAAIDKRAFDRGEG